MPARAQWRTGNSLTANGKGSGARSIRIGYSAPAFGFGRSGRPPETSETHRGSRPRA